MTTAADNTDRESAKARWRIKDLIDLEYFLHGGPRREDNGNNITDVPENRNTYLSRLRHLRDDGSPAARRLLIWRWLGIQRERETGTLPGSIYAETSRICLAAAAVLGLFAGISLALSLLDYSGIRPLNVSVYMGVAVFSQMLLILFLAMVVILRVVSRSWARNSVLMRLIGRMLSAAIFRIRRGDRLDGHKREALAAATGLLRGRRQVYGSIFFWPPFILLQLFALCFNVGLLGATLLKLSGSDVAFGWQSTFQVSEPAVFRLVETLAFPWRWMVPPSLAYPSLDAIEGSRIILKEGIATLTTGDLVAWWPFLCFSVFFYGLLPRLVLLISGILIKRNLLARLRLDHGACNRLVRSMVSPRVSTEGVPGLAPAPDPAGTVPPRLENAAPGHADGVWVALVPEDIGPASHGLEAVAARELALQVTDRKIFGADETDDQPFFDLLEQMAGIPNLAGVLVLQEAWQPPIQENMNFLRQLRRRLGDRAGIVVGLVGKPTPDTIFTPPREEDHRIWKQRVEALGDPYLGVERLVFHD